MIKGKVMGTMMKVAKQPERSEKIGAALSVIVRSGKEKERKKENENVSPVRNTTPSLRSLVPLATSVPLPPPGRMILDVEPNLHRSFGLESVEGALPQLVVHRMVLEAVLVEHDDVD